MSKPDDPAQVEIVDLRIACGAILIIRR